MLGERETPRPEALKEPFPKKLRSFSDCIADTDIRCDARGLRRLHVREGTVTHLPNRCRQRLQRWRCRLIPARHSLILKGTTLIRELFAISTTERESRPESPRFLPEISTPTEDCWRNLRLLRQRRPTAPRVRVQVHGGLSHRICTGTREPPTPECYGPGCIRIFHSQLNSLGLAWPDEGVE